MKTTLTIISILLLSAGCALPPAINADNPIQTDNILNGYGWQIMSPNQKILYIRGYVEGVISGTVFFVKSQLPHEDKAHKTFVRRFNNSFGLLKVNDIVDGITQSYLKYPKEKAMPVVELLGVIILEALKHEK